MSRLDTKPVVVVGAGLTGLSAAWHLHQAGRAVMVLDAGDTPGGVIQSQWVDGVLMERGPHTFQSSAEPMFNLCESLGLTPQPASPLAKKRFIWWRNKLQPVPSSPVSFFTTPLLSASAKWQLLQEPFVAPRTAMKDHETLGDWACRRLGPDVLTTLLGPFVSGVYAGNPATLSASATFPSLSRFESEHGSVVRGLFHKLSNRPKPTTKKRPYGLYNFENGMATLPRTLAERLPDVRLNHRLLGIQRQGNGTLSLRVHAPTGEKHIAAEQVVLTLPSHQLAHVFPLGTFPPELLNADSVPTIPYAPMMVAQVVVKKADVAHPLDGFGFLVPRATGIRVLGSIWTSQLFPNRAPEDSHLLSVFIGGATDPHAMGLSDDDVEALIRKELGPMMGMAADASLSVMVVRYDKAIPQYTVGHQQRVADVLEAIGQFSASIHVGGNYTHGVALHDCITEGERLAQQVIQSVPSLPESGIATSKVTVATGL